MKKTFLWIALLLVLLAACGQRETLSDNTSEQKVPSWQEQYDLGVRYLSEGNYQEAIIAFTAAIEIDPKRAEAYAGLADAYLATGDDQSAIEILSRGIDATRDSALSDRLEKLAAERSPGEGEGAGEADEPAQNNGSDDPFNNASDEMVFDKNGRLVRQNYYSADGVLIYYRLLASDGEADGISRWDGYDADGTMTGYTLYYPSEDGLVNYSENFTLDGVSQGKSASVTDENGKWLYSGWADDSGNVIPSSVAQYDENGNGIGWNNYNDAGELTGYARYENGTTVYYEPDGSLSMFMGTE